MGNLFESLKWFWAQRGGSLGAAGDGHRLAKPKHPYFAMGISLNMLGEQGWDGGIRVRPGAIAYLPSPHPICSRALNHVLLLFKTTYS